MSPKALALASTWLVEHEILSLLVLAPLLVAGQPAALAWLAAFLLPAIWLLVWKARGSASATVYDPPLLCFLLLLPLSLLHVTDVSLALPRILNLALGAALLRALARGPAQPSIRWAGRAIVSLVAGVALLALVETDWISAKVLPLEPLYQWLPRLIVVALPHSIRGGIHPNEIAGTLGLLLPIAVSVTLSGPVRWPIRTLMGSAVILALAVLVLTQSRMGYVGTGCGLLVVLLGWLISRRRRWSWPLAVAAAVSGAAGIAWGAIRIFSGAWFPRGGDNLDTLGVRLEFWDRALSMLRDFPLTGIGLGHFSIVLHTAYAPVLISPQKWVAHAHNFPLQLALDFGIPAAAAFVVILTVGCVRLARLTTCRDPRVLLLALGCLGGIVAFLVFGLGDAIALGARPSVLLWIVLGLAEALWLSMHPCQRRERV